MVSMHPGNSFPQICVVSSWSVLYGTQVHKVTKGLCLLVTVSKNTAEGMGTFADS